MELPLFSDKSREYFTRNTFSDYSNIEPELISHILERDKLILDTKSKDYEVEHLYIDFRDIILGEKVRKLAHLKKAQNEMKFNDVYYANWMA